MHLMMGYTRILVNWNRRIDLEFIFSLLYIYIINKDRLTIKAAGIFEGYCMTGRECQQDGGEPS